jgi:hypothetical protein
MSDELKPCPFCGTKLLTIQTMEDPRWVKCEHCGTGWMGLFWQRRPIEDALRARIQALEAEVVSETKWAAEYHQNWQDALARVAALEQANAWISVEDRLPEVGADVFVWARCLLNDNWGRWGTVKGYYMGEGSWQHNFYGDDVEITHWRPLPPPPDGKAETQS